MHARDAVPRDVHVGARQAPAGEGGAAARGRCRVRGAQRQHQARHPHRPPHDQLRSHRGVLDVQLGVQRRVHQVRRRHLSAVVREPSDHRRRRQHRHPGVLQAVVQARASVLLREDALQRELSRDGRPRRRQGAHVVELHRAIAQPPARAARRLPAHLHGRHAIEQEGGGFRDRIRGG